MVWPSDVLAGITTIHVAQPLTGKVLTGQTSNRADNSRLNIKCYGFWNTSQDAFMDVRVYNCSSLHILVKFSVKSYLSISIIIINGRI
jgi:hypothetical protein